MTIGEFNGEGTEYYDYCSNCGYEFFDDDPLNYCPNCGRRIEVESRWTMAEYVCELPVEGMASFMSGGELIPVHERIVRCRDCKRVTIDQGDHEYREPLWCGLFHIDVSLDGFCKWGVRRTDG